MKILFSIFILSTVVFAKLTPEQVSSGFYDFLIFHSGKILFIFGFMIAFLEYLISSNKSNFYKVFIPSTFVAFIIGFNSIFIENTYIGFFISILLSFYFIFYFYNRFLEETQNRFEVHNENN